MYMTIAQLTKEFNQSRSTVNRRVTGIKSEIGKRYPATAVLNHLINVDAYMDYEANRELLNDHTLRNGVAPFR